MKDTVSGGILSLHYGMQMELYLVLFITIFTSALIQGMTGFGSALVAMAVLPLFLPIKTITPLVLLVGLLLNIIIFLRFHQHFDMKKLFPILIGAAAGVPVGVYGLKMIDERTIKMVLGAVLFLYGGFALTGKKLTGTHSGKWGYAFGFLSGCLGGAINTSGPPVVIHASLQRWDQREVITTLQSFFIVSGIYTLIMHSLHGLFTLTVLRYWILLVPAQVAGVFLGIFLHSRINEELFRKIVYMLLIAFSMIIFYNIF